MITNIPPRMASPLNISFLICLKVSVSPDIFAWIIRIALFATNPPKIAKSAFPNWLNIFFADFATFWTGLSRVLPTDLPTPSNNPSFFFFLSESSCNCCCLKSSLCSFFFFSASPTNIFVTFSIFNFTIFFNNVIFLELFCTCLTKLIINLFCGSILVVSGSSPNLGFCGSPSGNWSFLIIFESSVLTIAPNLARGPLMLPTFAKAELFLPKTLPAFIFLLLNIPILSFFVKYLPVDGSTPVSAASTFGLLNIFDGTLEMLDATLLFVL